MGGEKGDFRALRNISITKVIIEQENLNLEKNISCLGLRVLTVGEMPLVFSHLSSSLVIPLNSLVLTITSRKKKKKRIQNCTFNYHFLSMQLLFPTIPWTHCLGPPTPRHPPTPGSNTRGPQGNLCLHTAHTHTLVVPVLPMTILSIVVIIVIILIPGGRLNTMVPALLTSSHCQSPLLYLYLPFGPIPASLPVDTHCSCANRFPFIFFSLALLSIWKALSPFYDHILCQQCTQMPVSHILPDPFRQKYYWLPWISKGLILYLSYGALLVT